MGMLADLHMHSAASDGTDGAGEMARMVAEAGISVFALTDHDTVAGADEVRAPDGVVFIPGIEFSCRMGSGKCHILGYGCNGDSEEFKKILTAGENLRRAKLEARLEFLGGLGVRLPEGEVTRLRSMPSAGKPHISNLMVEYGFAADTGEAMEIIDRCPASSGRLQAEAVIRGILRSGGVPVWAHPLGGEGEMEASRESFDRMLAELMGYGLQGLECFYSKYALERCLELEREAGRNGLCVSGGSDYHGKNKNIAMGTLNADGVDIPADRLTVLGRLMR